MRPTLLHVYKPGVGGPRRGARDRTARRSRERGRPESAPSFARAGPTCDRERIQGRAEESGQKEVKGVGMVDVMWGEGKEMGVR